MDSEDYAMATELLNQVATVNPRLPKLWALRAAIAHLLGIFTGKVNRVELVLNPGHSIPKSITSSENSLPNTIALKTRLAISVVHWIWIPITCLPRTNSPKISCGWETKKVGRWSIWFARRIRMMSRSSISNSSKRCSLNSRPSKPLA